MKLARFLTASLIFTIFQATDVLAFSMCKDGDRLYVPFMEFAKDERRVLFAGIVHGGPKGFYSRIHDALENWLHLRKGPVTILTEFYTCDGATRNLRPETKLDGEQLKSLLANDGNMKLFEKSSVKEKCEIDIDKKTKRPIYLVQRNVRECANRHREGFECQWGDLILPTGKNVTVMSADINLDAKSEFEQVAFSMGYRSTYEVDPGNREAMDKLFEEVMIKRRDVEMNRVLKEVLRDNRTVIINWGSRHLEGLEKTLLAEGFKLVSADSVLYGGRESLGKWKQYDRSYEADLAKAVSRNEHCSLKHELKR